MCKTSTNWVTFVHGAGGSSVLWYKQIREFSKNHNVLLVDLRGHGDSKPDSNYTSKYTLPQISKDIIDVLDFENIEKTHFVGMSLGTIIVREIGELYPERVVSMVMGGAVLELNFKAKFLLNITKLVKNIIPYLFLYHILAYILMPKERHKQSRNLFVQEAQKLYQKEFCRWFTITIGMDTILKHFQITELPIPTLYIMGEDDYMFLAPIKRIVKNHVNFSKLIVVPNSGHVVNVDNAKVFNRETLLFLTGI